jgi:hypothetical protein
MYEVKGYPTLLYFPSESDKFYKYSGMRRLEDLENFALK